MKPWILAATGLALCGKAMAAGGEKITPAEDANIRAVAYAATVANFTATNGAAFVRALSPQARVKWEADEKALRIRGVQCFIPDFFKVLYSYSGAVSGDAFCFGLYNPFYDQMLLCKAENVKRPVVTDYKWLSGVDLRGDSVVQRYPCGTGVTAADDYFPTMLQVLGDTLKAFNAKFLKNEAGEAFLSAPALDEKGRTRLLDTASLRMAQVQKVTTDKKALAVAFLARHVLADAVCDDKPFVGKDSTTLAVQKTLKDIGDSYRKSFKMIGYFEAGKTRCVLHYNVKLPTFLVLAMCDDENTIRLGMFDAHIADGWKNKLAK